jgi:hypothetical protein
VIPFLFPPAVSSLFGVLGRSAGQRPTQLLTVREGVTKFCLDWVGLNSGWVSFSGGRRVASPLVLGRVVANLSVFLGHLPNFLVCPDFKA